MTKSGAIKCLGKSFVSEDERREYFRKELRKKLPELKKIEGFPIGEDEDVIALSDPPYYTACPNPWLNDFIAEWEKEKETLPGRKKNFKVDEPYASDISEGKNNPIYNAHTYHTKVPHPAIMRYILHYTQPGDIIFDGFAGTGMTGVAAQLCDTADRELQLRIDNDRELLLNKTSEWGLRHAICSDLSPVASFIATNYNTIVDVEEFEASSTKILNDVEHELGWMYHTYHTGKTSPSTINYMVWSEVFSCPNCNSEIVFYDVAVNKDGTVNEEFECSGCSSKLTKRGADKKRITIFDKETKKSVEVIKFIPVLINYHYAGKAYEKRPDKYDYETLDKIDNMTIPYWFPIDEVLPGDKTGEPLRVGIRNIHQFYSRRNLIILAAIKAKCTLKQHHLWFNSQLINLSKLNRYRPGVSFPYNPLNGTLYIASQISEANVFVAYKNKIKRLSAAYRLLRSNNPVAVSSATASGICKNSIDYIFTDPPFGANIMYSELNYLNEGWLKVKTNNKDEAVESRSQSKSLLHYQDIMSKCFIEYFKVLKPDKWMTVEFSNTSAAVWNGIQTALQRAGFVIANVAAIDKQQGSFNAVTSTTAVKQDLVISCYKPSSSFENRFNTGNSDVNVWEFIREHLNHLPVLMLQDNKPKAIIERSSKILYDRLISFYLMRGLPIPIDAIDLLSGLKQKFIERDGMFFTAEQAAEYDRQRGKYGESDQLRFVFDIIYSENDAVQWLKERLRNESQTYQDIMPEFRKANVATRKGEREIELKTVLEENFIQEAGSRWRVPDMNEAKDREALRTKALLKEFDRYIVELNTSKTKKLKEVRLEALRAGFKSCWEKKDFQTIVTMGDKIPQNLLLEDEQLLMFYDIAKDRI